MQRLQQVHDKYGPINLRSLKYSSAILPVVPDNDGCFVKRYSMTFAFSFAPSVIEMTLYSAEGNPVGTDPK